MSDAHTDTQSAAAPTLVSVVVPLLEEGATARELVARLGATLDGRGVDYEIVLVDDGSRDGSQQVLRAIERENPRVRVFELARNFGQAAALACGLFAARGDIVVTMDGDLQNPPEEIPRLLDALEGGAAIATASRGVRHDRAWRRVGARFVHHLARVLTGVDIDDFGGQFKAYRREVVELTRGIWGPGKPFFPLALWLGFPVAEVRVRHDPRSSGDSRYGLASLVRVNLDLITSFTTLPLVAMGLVGVLALGAGLLLLAGLLAAGAGVVPALVALALVAVGSTFTAASVVGVYVGRIYRSATGEGAAFVVRSRPLRDAGSGEAGFERTRTDAAANDRTEGTAPR